VSNHPSLCVSFLCHALAMDFAFGKSTREEKTV
jgi:hypothetical protein